MAVDLDRFKTLLLGMQQASHDQSDKAFDARKPVELDQQSVGRLSRQDALQQQAMANAQEQLRKREMMRINQALARISNGEFGYCLECGDEIAPKRLEIDPIAELCIACKG